VARRFGDDHARCSGHCDVPRVWFAPNSRDVSSFANVSREQALQTAIEKAELSLLGRPVAH
jgi:hypothetical protein